MPSNANKISALILCGVLSHADINFFTSVQGSHAYLGFKNQVKLIPGSITAPSYWNNLEQMSAFKLYAAEITGQYALDDEKGFYGSIGYAAPSENDRLFGMGTYSMTLNHQPNLGIGGYYETQSRSQISLGLNFMLNDIELNANSNGLLFNDSTPADKVEIKPITAQILAKISIPLTSSIDMFASYGHGVTNFNVELDINEDIPACNNPALATQSGLVMPLGNQLSVSPSVLSSSIAIGVRAHTYTYND